MERITCSIICLCVLVCASASAEPVFDGTTPGDIKGSIPNALALNNLQPSVNSSFPDNLRFVQNEAEPIHANDLINIREYFPSKQGNKWTYSYVRKERAEFILKGKSEEITEGTLSVSISGTETLCGLQCSRMEVSDGTKMVFILNNSGLSMARYVLPNNTYIEYCPPVNFLPARVELGSEVQYSHKDSPCITAEGTPCLTALKKPLRYIGKGTYKIYGPYDLSGPAGDFSECIIFERNYHFESTDGRGYGDITEKSWNVSGIGVVQRIMKQVIVNMEGPKPVKTRDSEETLLLESYSVRK